jgi:hypothetical protein
MPKLPKLTDVERIKLQNIMYRAQISVEKESRLKMELNQAIVEQHKAEKELDEWKKKYNKKLRELNLTVDDIEINVETGEIKVLKPLKLHKDMVK